MTIHGLQGLDDPHSIRSEIERGGRFVLFTYCISVIFMTFKRSSDLHFIRPGESAVLRGLPFSLISFFLGWWGFPWGFIYTIEALVKNFGGGTDVTALVLADLERANPSSAPALTPSGALPPALPLRGDAPSAPALAAGPRSSIGTGIFRLALFILGAGTLGWMGVALYRGSNVETALVNGLSTPLAFSLDGTPYQLRPNSDDTITLAEGAHTLTWTTPDGRKETHTFDIKTPFWPRPLNRSVAIINPDRTALIYHETTRYFPTDQPMPEGKNDHVLHVGQVSYVFPAADYFFEDFPSTISLPDRRAVSKTRYAHARELDYSQRVYTLGDDVDAAHDLALHIGELFPEDEHLTRLAFERLKPEETETYFALHLNDRPLRLEWHRFYQTHVEYNRPDIDLSTYYRQLAAELPDDGAAAYLAARIESDRAARRAYLKQASDAARPCAYATNSLAYEALGEGRFADALTHLRDTEKLGLDSLSFRATQRDVLLANGLHDEALAVTHSLRVKQPKPFSAPTLTYLTLELSLACTRQPGDPQVESAITQPYLASIQQNASPDQLSLLADQLVAVAAYARGDETTYAARLASNESYRFAVAITRGDHSAAAAALETLPRANGTSWLLTYLASCDANAAQDAEACYEKALAAFANESNEHRAVAARLRAGDANPALICAELLSVEDKTVIATALGHRFPEHRAEYHALAAKLNFKPEFPARFLARHLQSAPVAASISL